MHNKWIGKYNISIINSINTKIIIFLVLIILDTCLSPIIYFINFSLLTIAYTVGYLHKNRKETLNRNANIINPIMALTILTY